MTLRGPGGRDAHHPAGRAAARARRRCDAGRGGSARRRADDAAGGRGARGDDAAPARRAGPAARAAPPEPRRERAGERGLVRGLVRVPTGVVTAAARTRRAASRRPFTAPGAGACRRVARGHARPPRAEPPRAEPPRTSHRAPSHRAPSHRAPSRRAPSRRAPNRRATAAYETGTPRSRRASESSDPRRHRGQHGVRSGTRTAPRSARRRRRTRRATGDGEQRRGRRRRADAAAADAIAATDDGNGNGANSGGPNGGTPPSNPNRLTRAPLLPHHRHRLRQRRAAPRARAREDRRRRHRALPSAARRRRPLPHRHGRARAEGGADRRSAGRAAAGVRRRHRRASSRPCGRALGISVRPVHPHHRPDAQGRRARAHRAHLRRERRSPRTTSTSSRTPAGTASAARAFKQPAEIVDGKCVLHPTRTLEEVNERNWFFRLSAYSSVLQALFAEQPVVPRAREPPQRDPAAPRAGARGHLRQPLALRLGRSLPAPAVERRCRRRRTSGSTRCPTTSRRASSPATPTRPRWPANLHVIGKDITRFHAVIWPAMLMAAGSRSRGQVWAHGFVLLGGERFSKSAGVKLDARRGHRALRRRCVPLLPAPRGPLRRRRQLLVGAVRGALQQPTSPTRSATSPAAPSR